MVVKQKPRRDFAQLPVNRWWALVPPALVIVGGACIYRSPWPMILRQRLHGEHVTVFPRFETVGLPLITLVLWVVAIVLSIRLSRKVHKRQR